jgi:hypothetical protein
LPIGHSLGLQLFRHGSCGYDGYTGTEVVGFRFNRASNIGVVLVTTSAGRTTKRAVLSRIVESMPNVSMSTSNQEVELEARGESAALDIAGDYAGDHSLYANVQENGGRITLTIKSRREDHFQVHGVRDNGGSLAFAPKIPGLEPSFFRYARTGEVGLMFGMFAMKKMRGIAGKRILSTVKGAPHRMRLPVGDTVATDVSRDATLASHVPDDDAHQALL